MISNRIQIFRTDRGLSRKELAALVEPLSVAVYSVTQSIPMLGAKVGILGAGPIGLAVVAFARFAGARSIAVSEIDPVRRARAEGFGARVLIDPAAERLPVAEVIFECVGVAGLLQDCIALAPTRGRIVVVGVNRGEDVILPRVAIRKELSLQFVLGYQHEDFALVLDLMAQGRIDAAALVTRVIGLDDLPEVFERLRRPGPDAKVLIDPSL